MGPWWKVLAGCPRPIAAGTAIHGIAAPALLCCGVIMIVVVLVVRVERPILLHCLLEYLLGRI